MAGRVEDRKASNATVFECLLCLLCNNEKKKSKKSYMKASSLHISPRETFLVPSCVSEIRKMIRTTV